MVWRLDRSLKDLIARADALRTQGVGLRSLKEAIDTDSSTGQLVFHIFGALAELERALIRERTRAGLATARARGRVGGGRKLLGKEQRRHAVELYRSRQCEGDLRRSSGFPVRRCTPTSRSLRKATELRLRFRSAVDV